MLGLAQQRRPSRKQPFALDHQWFESILEHLESILNALEHQFGVAVPRNRCDEIM